VHLSETVAAAGGRHEYSDRNILIRSHADLPFIRAKVSGGRTIGVGRGVTQDSYSARCYANSQIILSRLSRVSTHITRVYSVCVCVCVCVCLSFSRTQYPSYIYIILYYAYITVFILYYHGRGKRSIVLVPRSFAAVVNGRSAQKRL